MTRGTRYFLLGSAAILIVGLAVGVVGYFGGLPGLAFTKAAGPDELRYVPKDAVVVAYANVHDVMASSFRQRVKQFEPAESEKGQQELKETLGIDLEHDIHHVLGALLAGSGSPEKNGLILAVGALDQTRIEAFISEKGGVAEEYKGRRLFTPPHGSASSDMPAFAFLSQGLAAFGSAAAVRRAIDLASGEGESVLANDEMMRMIQAADEGNAWAVGRFEAIASQARLPEEVASQLPPITWFSASGRVNGGIEGIVSMQARDKESAENLRAVMNGALALVRMQTGAKPEIQNLTQAIQLQSDGERVAVSFRISPELIDQLTGLAKKR